MIVAALLFAVLIAAWRWCEHRRIRHAAAVADFDDRERKLHADVDELLHALTDMEAARPYLECEVLVAENLA